ncbi:BlaI/MecI/CopY family transcriptional regulator [Anaerovorax odorimutans]|uniref:BlaI/MecI/CopY family transcriptional regulator n=1 Tax=Anaerovorax odorimutans TaxID=109327 RepID=UPI0003FE2734|nr:BlaI/MecI/CopY family transcriptional regulator [Anaerovorax odorimutans]
MNEIKLPDSEIKVMDILWEYKELSAKDTAQRMNEAYGWKKNTTYTVLKKLQEKGVIERSEPGFICKPIIGREQVGRTETKSLLDRFYKGSAATLFSAFLKDKSISNEEIDEIKAMIEKMK